MSWSQLEPGKITTPNFIVVFDFKVSAKVVYFDKKTNMFFEILSFLKYI